MKKEDQEEKEEQGILTSKKKEEVVVVEEKNLLTIQFILRRLQLSGRRHSIQAITRILHPCAAPQYPSLSHVPWCLPQADTAAFIAEYR